MKLEQIKIALKTIQTQLEKANVYLYKQPFSGYRFVKTNIVQRGYSPINELLKAVASEPYDLDEDVDATILVTDEFYDIENDHEDITLVLAYGHALLEPDRLSDIYSAYELAVVVLKEKEKQETYYDNDDIQKVLEEFREFKSMLQEETSDDLVQHPSHYMFDGIECIDYIRAVLGLDGFRAYCKGNVIKYITREAGKNKDEDLAKAKQYIEFALSK